jgi:hypothetical protein
VQLFGYLEKGASSNDDGASNKAIKNLADFFSRCQRASMYKETHKTIPDDDVLHICFFKQCQNADHASGILNQLKKEKKEKRP